MCRRGTALLRTLAAAGQSCNAPADRRMPLAASCKNSNEHKIYPWPSALKCTLKHARCLRLTRQVQEHGVRLAVQAVRELVLLDVAQRHGDETAQAVLLKLPARAGRRAGHCEGSVPCSAVPPNPEAMQAAMLKPLSSSEHLFLDVKIGNAP